MAFFNDTYCQLCERFIAKEQWINHVYSSRPLHREKSSYWPALFPQTKLVKDKIIMLEKAFWKMFLATSDIKKWKSFG